MVHIIGIAGTAGSGKDTFAQFVKQFLEQKGFVVHIKPFAAAIKETTRQLFDLDYRDVYTQEGKRQYIHDLPITVREALIRIGTDVARTLYKDIWVWRTMRDLAKLEEQYHQDVFVLIPDLRFYNEYQVLKEQGRCVRIVSNMPTTGIRSHISEWDLNPYPYFGAWYKPASYWNWLKHFIKRGFRRRTCNWDNTIKNMGSLDDLKNQAKEFADQIAGVKYESAA